MVPNVAPRRTGTDLAARVRAEFEDMPGVRLTLAQAARLWSADRTECEAVLKELTARGLLCRVGSTYLLRADRISRSA